MNSDEQAVANRSAEAMWADDRASQGLGMRLEAVGPGTATLSMTITDAMVNGLGICHGGFVFTLADSACAFASNSRNQRMVLSNATIALIAPARLGMKLVAEATERQRNERSGIYDIAVRTETGTTIAEFRGQVRSIPGKLVE
ncbi:MAG: hydroxyphenylacetyl-CoA thioesterase PaaI [Proteobacteria bacterium]|nr:hydroxyphenylacetyl-CoA thioesterase PaaI [Pseudomonadota bacterium]